MFDLVFDFDLVFRFLRSSLSVRRVHPGLRHQALGVFLGERAYHNGNVPGLPRCHQFRQQRAAACAAHRTQVPKAGGLAGPGRARWSLPSRRARGRFRIRIRIRISVGIDIGIDIGIDVGINIGIDIGTDFPAPRNRAVLLVDEAMGHVFGNCVARKGRLAKGLEARLFHPGKGTQDLGHLFALRRGRSVGGWIRAEQGRTEKRRRRHGSFFLFCFVQIP
mmetsp:Transcript_7355/g.18460  ORF Transcript_7355/g.18460 Transcript_7355/m.18460 type:complete len:220 (-) Transcript_7355:172-831(-)